MRRSFMKLFHDTIGKVIAKIREVWYRKALQDYTNGVYKISPKPTYISQLADAQKSKIKGFYQTINDLEAAKRLGASSVDEFSYWAWRACGIVGVQMVLQAQLGRSFNKSTMDLVNEGLSLGGYNLKSDSGWYHTTLSQIAQDHEIVSRLSKFVSLSQIAKIALDGNYVLASIKSLSGGHLLLIWGVRIDKGKLISFIVHDPNNYTYSGESKEISIESFNKLFTRRIIIFENKEGRSVKSDRV